MASVIGVVLEEAQDVVEVGAGDGVAADADAGGLAVALVGGLLDGFVGQGAGAGDYAYLPRQVDVAGHDADLALAGGDDAGAVGADEAAAGGVQAFLDEEHVEGGDALGDADDEIEAGVHCLQN